jgi:hypothetical protein
MSIVGKPVLMDKLDAEACAKVAAWIADDTIAAKRRREEKKRRKAEAKRKREGGAPG